jgi:hypothetical protein
MIDWNAMATPPKEVPDVMRVAAKLMYRETCRQSMRSYERLLDIDDKYYFSTSEAHALDRRTK